MGCLHQQHGCGVMCRHGQRAEERQVSWGELWASISLGAGGEEESIDIISSSLVTVKCMGQGRFSGLMCLCFASVLPQTNQEPGNPLWSMKKCFLITVCFLMQQGKEGWGWGNQACFGHLCFMVMLACFCLLSACFQAFYMGQPRKVAMWSASHKAYSWVGDLLWKYCVSGSGRSSGAWSGCDHWPEEMCVSAETHCLQGIGNKPPRKPEKCFIS